ncbi:MAG: oligosaccharide flippase family protein [Pseudomonadota bacterium]
MDRKLMLPSQSKYAFSAGVFLAARLAGAVAGAVSLLILGQLLEKAALGGYVQAFAVAALAGVLATLGLDRALLMHVAPRADGGGALLGAGLAVRTLLCAALAALAVSLGLLASAEPLSAAGFEAVASWLPMAACLVPIVASVSLTRSWLEANHRAERSNAMQGIADVSRCLLFAVVLWLGLGPFGVGAAAVFAGCLPLLIPIMVLRGAGRITAPDRLNWSDLGAGLRHVPTRLCMIGARMLDVVIIGLVLPPAVVAEYAVATRLAGLCELIHLALLPTFQARARHAIAAGNEDLALREYDAARLAAVLAALAGATMLVFFGHWVLAAFGEFTQAYPALLILAAAQVVRAGTGPFMPLLTAQGMLGAPLLLQGTGLIILVLLSPMLAAHGGLEGGAAATAIMIVTVAVLGTCTVGIRTSFRLVRPLLVVALVVQLGLLVAIAAGALDRVTGTVLLGVLWISLLALFGVEPLRRFMGQRWAR